MTSGNEVPSTLPPKRDWFDRMDILAKLALSLAGLILSAVIGFSTIHHNRLASQRQIQNQIDSMKLQRRTTAAQMLASQLPVVLRGDERERTLVLDMLEVIDPELVRRIAEKLAVHASTPEAAAQARQVMASSVEAAQQDAVVRHIENAGKYRDVGLEPAAAREYANAYKALPPSQRARWAKQIKAAENDYESGDYSGAVRKYEAVLRQIEKGRMP